MGIFASKKDFNCEDFRFYRENFFRTDRFGSTMKMINMITGITSTALKTTVRLLCSFALTIKIQQKMMQPPSQIFQPLASKKLIPIVSKKINAENILLFFKYFLVMLLSVPFLLVTFCVYAYVKELRNHHGKCLMSYVISLIILYLSFGISNLTHNDLYEIKWLCRATGYVSYISILFCFLWLNVMCYDIWLTFR